MSTGSCYLSKSQCPSSTYVMPEFYKTVYGAYSIGGVMRIMYDIYSRGPVETALYVSGLSEVKNFRFVNVKIVNPLNRLRTKPSFSMLTGENARM